MLLLHFLSMRRKYRFIADDFAAVPPPSSTLPTLPGMSLTPSSAERELPALRRTAGRAGAG